MNMIKLEYLGSGVMQVTVPHKLNSGDFLGLAPEVEAAIKEHGAVRLLIDASRLEGWDNFAALEKHAAFVKSHQGKVERIAVIAQHEWQHWLVGAVRVFLHPEVKVFNTGQQDEALQWLEKSGERRHGQTVTTLAGERVETLIADMADGR
jgi:hypothetical protein